MVSPWSVKHHSLPLRVRLRYGLASGLSCGMGVSSFHFIFRDAHFVYSIVLLFVLQLFVIALHLVSIRKTRPAVWAAYGLWIFNALGLVYFSVYTANTFFECSTFDVPRRLAGCQQRLVYAGGPVTVEYAHDGSFVLLAGGDGTLQTWSPEDHQRTTLVAPPSSGRIRERQRATISFDSAMIGVVREDTIELRDSTTGALRETLKPTSHTITSIQFMPDTLSLILTSGTTQTLLLDITTHRIQRTIDTRHVVEASAIAHNARMIALFGDSNELELYDPQSGHLLAVLPHQSKVTSVAFAPDGSLLISGDTSGQLYNWSTQDFHLTYVTQAFGDDEALSIAFSPDGRVFATSNEYDSGQTAIRFWMTIDGSLMRALPQRYAWNIIFAPDGTSLIAGGSRDVFVWNAPSASALK